LRVSGDARADAELLADTARGDDVAFAVLVRRYIRAATLLSAQLLGDSDDAEDIVQDAFMVVHRKATTLDVHRPFAPWFFAIVRRLASNRRARDLRRERLLRLSGSRTLADPSRFQTHEAFVAHANAEMVTRAIERLSPMQRACFDLVAVRGLMISEVAVMHGISESTVRQHVFRARATLRTMLDGSNPESNRS